jgi:hypothetical protein
MRRPPRPGHDSRARLRPTDLRSPPPDGPGGIAIGAVLRPEPSRRSVLRWPR